MTSESDQAGSPWYRQPWMWLVVGLPLASVIASLTTVGIAVKNRDDLVRDDWYKAGRSINQDVHADRLAQELGLSASLVLHPAELAVSVEVKSAPAVALPEQLQLVMVHSTIANEDMTVLLQRGADGLWHGRVPKLPMGKRHMLLEPLMSAGDQHRWRLRAGDVMFQGEPVALSPAF
ncbi:MAG: FixH family protein [Gammaproteobacteria bacterium]